MRWTVATDLEYLSAVRGPHLRPEPGVSLFRVALMDHIAEQDRGDVPTDRLGRPIDTERLYYWVSAAEAMEASRRFSGRWVDGAYVEGDTAALETSWEREDAGLFAADSKRAWWLYQLACTTGAMADQPDAHWWAPSNGYEGDPPEPISRADAKRLVKLGLVKLGRGSSQAQGKAITDLVSTLREREAERVVVGRYRDWNALGDWQEVEQHARKTVPADAPFPTVLDAAGRAHEQGMMLPANLALLESIAPLVERHQSAPDDPITFNEVVGVFGRSQPNTTKRWRSLVRTGWVPHGFATSVSVASRGRFYRRPDDYEAFAAEGHPGWKGD